MTKRKSEERTLGQKNVPVGFDRQTCKISFAQKQVADLGPPPPPTLCKLVFEELPNYYVQITSIGEGCTSLLSKLQCKCGLLGYCTLFIAWFVFSEEKLLIIFGTEKLYSKSLPHENNVFHFKEMWIVKAVHYMLSGWWWDIGKMLFLGLQTIHENFHAQEGLLNINVFMAKAKYQINTWFIFSFFDVRINIPVISCDTTHDYGW